METEAPRLASCGGSGKRGGDVVRIGRECDNPQNDRTCRGFGVYFDFFGGGFRGVLCGRQIYAVKFWLNRLLPLLLYAPKIAHVIYRF